MALPQNRKLLAGNVFTYGLTHALIDGACAAQIAALYGTKHFDVSYLAIVVVVYNLLAFAIQPLTGILVDWLKAPQRIAALGCLLVAGGFLFMSNPVLVVCLAGVGNALFHVGGGVVSLNLIPGKASVPGLFVAPGDIGLLCGGLIGASGQGLWCLAIGLLVIAVVILKIDSPSIAEKPVPQSDIHGVFPILLLILASVAIRGFVGLSLSYPWKNDLLLVYVLAVFLGKAFGGILGDRFGWNLVAVSGLLLSAVFLSLGKDVQILGVVGIFAFNLTMPVTLAVVANTLPQWKGFSFGLTAMALIAGALVAFSPVKGLFYGANWTIPVVVLVSAGMLFFGLRLYFKREEYRLGNKTEPV
ncbi:MAG: hypothetical protein ACM3MK_03715 [Chitinophagales bacterium]